MWLVLLFVATMSLSSALVGVLSATLSPDAATRKNAESQLLSAQAHPDFAPSILHLAQDKESSYPVRMAAALNFKNWVKANWAVRVPRCIPARRCPSTFPPKSPRGAP